MISILVFSPIANILFSSPSHVQAITATENSLGPSTISEGVTYGVGYVACLASELIGELWGKIKAYFWGATGNVPTGDKGAEVGGGSKALQRDQCAFIRGTFIMNMIASALRSAAISALHNLLTAITNQIIKCINSYDPKTGKCGVGGAGFVLDYNALLAQAADVAGAKFLNSLAGINLCSVTPKLKLQIALLPTPEFKKQAECTLTKVVGNIDKFYTDFSKGGWVAWEESLKPNNDAFGTWLMARDEKLALSYAAIMKKESETTDGFKATKKCIDPEGADPESVSCKMSIVTTPSGTVETSVNFAALSPIRTMEQTYSAFYAQHAGPYGVYLTAITNALLNKMSSEGLKALMGAITPKDLQSENPYQDILDEVANSTDDFSAAQANQSHLNLAATMAKDMDKYITDTAKPLYINLIAITTNIKNQQDKIINDFWSQGSWGSATATITFGPSVVPGSGLIQQTTTTTYKITHNQVGEALIDKVVTDYINGTTTTTYSLLNKKNQIEDIDGIISAYTIKLNALSYTQSQIAPAIIPIQTAYTATNKYINSWDGTSGSATEKAAMDKATADAIPFIQKIIPSTSTLISDLSSEITTLYNKTVDETTKEVSDQTQKIYQDYLAEVQKIYNDLSVQIIAL